MTKFSKRQSFDFKARLKNSLGARAKNFARRGRALSLCGAEKFERRAPTMMSLQ